MNAIDDALFQELIFWKLFLNFLCIFSRLFWTHSGMILIFLWTFSGLFLDSFWTFSLIFLNFSGFHVNSVDLSYWWIYFGPMYSGSNTCRGLRQVFTLRWIHFGSHAARFAHDLFNGPCPIVQCGKSTCLSIYCYCLFMILNPAGLGFQSIQVWLIVLLCCGAPTKMIEIWPWTDLGFDAVKIRWSATICIFK